jgi:hypothetical protein
MNWRRGLLLAGIHLAMGGTLVVWQEVRDWSRQIGHSSPKTTAPLRLTAWQETEQAVPFDPCNGGYVCYWVTPQFQVVSAADFPVEGITGWFLPCPAPWSVAGILHRGYRNESSRSVALLVAASFCALVPIQWFLIGAFPLTRPRWWWLEPGAIITIWTVVAFVMVLFPGARDLPQFPLIFAELGWLYWVGLLVWKGLRSGWRLIVRKPIAIG